MSTSGNTFVKVRVDPKVKAQASKVLDSMGVTMTEAVNSLLVRLAKEKCMPFEMREPTPYLLEAFAEVERGDMKTFDTIEELMLDLHAKD